MRIQRVWATAVLVLMSVVILGGLASAHHGRAGIYDTDRRIEMDGVVSEWRWRNPHTYLVWDVTDDQGKVVGWTGEMSSTTSMMSEGLSRRTFQAGQEGTFTIIPATAGTPQGELIKVVLTDGTVLVDREPGD
jgi:hypothetical protein